MVRFLLKGLKSVLPINSFHSQPGRLFVFKNCQRGFLLTHTMEESTLSPPSSVRDNNSMGVRTAGVIIIGDEVLKGTVKDENSYFLCQRLHDLGVKLEKISVIGDSIDSIAKEVKDFSSKYSFVITTGGIGPTHDDVTYDGIAKAFGLKMVQNEVLRQFWLKYYPKSDLKGDLNPSVKMSKIPESAEIIHTPFSTKLVRKGTFPFVKIENVYVFPGIPSYMRAGFTALEADHFTGWGTKFHSRVIYLTVNESLAVPALNETVDKFKHKVEIGSYPILNNQYFMTKLTLEALDAVTVDSASALLVSLLDPNWIQKDGELIGNAPNNVKKLIENEDQSPLSQLISHSYKVIDQCFKEYKSSEVFLCFNGGKDCTALLHLVHAYLMEHEPQTRLQVVYVRGRDPFPELEEFISSTANRYNLDMTEVAGPIKPSLEKLLEERKDWKAVLMGTRRSDPNAASLNSFQETDSGWPKLMRVSPILDWSYQDVWTFLRKLNVPYCVLYDKGYTSLGGRGNTKPNEDLAYKEGGIVRYKPAYLLSNESSERNGRI